MAKHLFYCLTVDPRMKDLVKSLTPPDFSGEVMYFGQVVEALNALSISTPEKIFINIQDYPRHWKIIQQIIGSETELILYSTSSVEEKERNKMRALGLKLVDTIDQDYFPTGGGTIKFSSETNLVTSTIILNNGEEIFITEVTSADSTGLTCRELPEWNQLSVSGTLALPTGQVLESIKFSRVPGMNLKLLFLNESEKVLEFLR